MTVLDKIKAFFKRSKPAEKKVAEPPEKKVAEAPEKKGDEGSFSSKNR